MAWTTCAQCKERFGLTDETEAVLRKSCQTFHCPWGHPLTFKPGPSEAELLRKERDTLKQQTARWQATAAQESERASAAERRGSAARGQVTKLKNRAAAGVCPCCNRTFTNLARHMAGQHPSFAGEPIPEGATVQ